MDKIKLKVDFYADGFRSGIIEVPSELEFYEDYQKRLYITEKLVEHLPNDRKWRLDGNPQRHDSIIIITVKYLKEKKCEKERGN